MRATAILAWVTTIAAAGPMAAEDLFDVLGIPGRARTVAAELAELDGDGRKDLFTVTLEGIPPEEKRTIGVHLQREDGSLPVLPDHRIAVPQWSAVYDVADLVPESPGEELVLLRPDGVTLLSLADASGRQWHRKVPGPTTAGLANDERGFEPYKLVYPELGEQPWILVPQIGQMTALTADGTIRSTLSIPRRANYLIMPRAGLISLESDFQIFLDVPKLALGDVDGDGRTDIVSSTRHELRVFLRDEKGGFSFEPDRSIPLRQVTPRDHIRGSGGVAAEARDIDGDGRLDLLLSAVRGGLIDAKSAISIYLNRGGQWDLSKPDQTLSSEASLASNALVDLDGNGKSELLRLEIRFSVLEVIELLISREIDVDLAIHRWGAEGGYPTEPYARKTLSFPFSFETFRLLGFIPIANTDMNGDGMLDLVSSGGGEEIEIFLGSERGPFTHSPRTQEMRTAGVLHLEDYDGDGLNDFLIFDPHNFDREILVGRNRGLLPGTSPQLVPRD